MSNQSATPVQIATIGASSSANKGAASMLQAVIDWISDQETDVRVDVLTTYPDADRRDPPRADPSVDLEIVPLTPLQLLLMAVPLAVAARAARAIGLPWRPLLRLRALRALAEADLVIDVAGISFVDGRGLPTLAYNTLMTGLPIVLGTPVVKCSQAMGPFEGLLNRTLAHVVLSRCVTVCPRGDQTESHVADLGLRNVVPAADLAFAMQAPAEAEDRAAELLGPDTSGRQRVAIMPSSVVNSYCEDHDIDYPALITGLIDDLVEDTDTQVVLVPHSWRDSDSPGRMNDGPICREIHAGLRTSENVLFLDESLTPTELRAVISRCDALVTSRFHAMISALATSTPVLVVGWSHKYAEVMREFDLEQWVIDFGDLPQSGLGDRTERLLGDRTAVREQITQFLPTVRERSEANFTAIEAALPALSAGVAKSGMIRTSLAGVREASMCIGCGACTIADPTVSVDLHPEKLIYEPTSDGGSLAASMCPAVEVDFQSLQAEVFPGAEITPYGVVDSVLLAQSTDRDRNLRSSSGGMIKELMLHLLADDEVDGIIALDHVDGLDFEARLLTELVEVDTLPGSIYHNLSQPRALELLRENEGRFALVAIPCQLEGIYKYIHECEPSLADKIHTTIGLLCGWQYSHHSIRAISEYLNIDAETIEDISYRGGGPVGKLRIHTRDGTEVSASRRVDFGYQVAFDRHFNTPRCHLCINHSNFLADIVVGDAWLPSTVSTKTGISLVICRSSHTRAFVDRLAEEERLVATAVGVEEIRESQTDRVIFGNFAYAYGEYLDELGVHHPDMVGPNREAATPVPRDEVVHFHRELVRKLELQRAGRYRFLFWRKATVELPKFLNRYWTWFTVRILKVKSLRGERQELSREQTAQFR